MNTVTTIHIGGRAYNVETDAYTALSAYLDKARAALEENPDKDEILADFEQAIAEKCVRYLSPNKNVILKKEVETIIDEMGPVEGSPKSDTSSSDGAKTESADTPKRLYRIKEGAIFAGVCNGIAAYFNVDVVIVRVIFVLIGILSHGAAIFGYLILMLIVPKAETDAEKAEARGAAFTAHGFIEDAKRKYADFKTDSRGWKREMRKQKRFWKYKTREAMREVKGWDHAWRPVAEAGSWIARILFGIVAIALTMGLAAAIVTLIATGAFFGFLLLPIGLPIWIAVIILLCLYNLILWPLRLVFFPRAHLYGNDGGWFGMWDGIMWIGILIIIGWAMYANLPGVHNLFDRIGHWIMTIGVH